MSDSASTRIDVNYLSVYNSNKAEVLAQFRANPQFLEDVDGSKFATVLKMTDGLTDLTLENIVVPNGHETSIDLDWARNVHVSGHFGFGNQLGDNVLRIKGGCRNCSFSGTLHSRGQRDGVDIEIGDWYDQRYAISGFIDLSGMTLHADGGKNRVAIGWCIPFTVKLGKNCEYMVWMSLKLKVYWLLKWAVRTALRIPVGTKGPSWL